MLLPRRHTLLITTLAPVIPQILGSIFNIWYNSKAVKPLLNTPGLEQRFLETLVAYNGLIYPVMIVLWVRAVFGLKPALQCLQEGRPDDLGCLHTLRRRVIHLPWAGAAISAVAWFGCIPVFLGALATTGDPIDSRLLWHLPISFLVSGFISITHSFFLIELTSHWGLFPVFFKEARADQTPGILALPLRARGLVWAVSAGICPIGSLLLLSFAPASPEEGGAWFEVFVGTVGIGFGLLTALMISRLVVDPIDQLRAAAQLVAQGRFDVEVPLQRADEFGVLIAEFNRMVRELREKERLRQTFGLHVGRQAAERILQRDPGLGGVEEVITVLFLDIRSFTTRSATDGPQEIVGVLNQFLAVMVRIVEEAHGGMVNKFLGDGFLALFGVGGAATHHADDAVAAARAMIRGLTALNESLTAQGRTPLAVGIGIHTGSAIVGSIGSPERLEYTAIGSTVNTASRIEGLTKSLGCPVLLTDATRSAMASAEGLTTFGAQPVRGLEEPIGVWGTS